MSESSRLVRISAQLRLPEVRRGTGLLDGMHRSILKGSGFDFDDMQLYSPGDDVGDIDWKSSARAGIPVIRRFIKETNLSVVLGVDSGRTMAAASPGGGSKGELAELAAGALAAIAHEHGDHIGLVAADADRLTYFPPRGGLRHAETVLRAFTGLFDVAGPTSSIAAICEQVLASVRRRSLVVVITDQSQPRAEDERILRHLRIKHEVMVVALRDLAPTAPLTAGAVTADVQAHWQLPPALRQDRRLATEVARAAEQGWAAAKEILDRAGIPQLVIGSRAELIGVFVQALGGRARVHR